MKNKEKYIDIFVKSLNIDKKKFSEKLKYNDIPEWDSINHMTLMSGLEEGFNITMESDDIIDFSSFKRGIQILKKYKINYCNFSANFQSSISSISIDFF